MQSYTHIAPPLRVFAGPACLDRLGRELERVGSRRALILCGASLAGSPALHIVQAALGPLCAGVFAGVAAHSPRPAVEAARDALRAAAADAVVAVGGGSAAVTARAAAILLAEPGSLEALATAELDGRLVSPKLLRPKLPQLVVPTTPTTACAKAGTAVFDPVAARRYALFDPKTRAQAVFLHPALLGTAPDRLVVDAALDTLSLAVEALLSPSSDPVADALLLHAVRLLVALVPQGGAVPAEDRMGLATAAVLAGRGSDHGGAGIATVLGHAIGANHGISNGAAKAVLLPHAVRFNGPAAAAGLGRLASALSVAPEPDAVAASLRALAGRAGRATRLRDLGLRRAELGSVAARGLADWFLRDNPRPVTGAAELERVLADAW
jgi:alcohol dehydrogenase